MKVESIQSKNIPPGKNYICNALNSSLQTNFPDEISVEDYAGLYGQLQREYRDLCRAYTLLQARCGQNSIQGEACAGNLFLQMFNLKCLDVEREERQINYYKNKLEAAETKMRDYDRCFNDTEGSDLIKKLIDEKESQTMKIFQMSEKLKMMEEREERLKTEVQDAKDQAELLEFRVLELEECQEKVGICIPTYQSFTPSNISIADQIWKE